MSFRLTRETKEGNVSRTDNGRSEREGKGKKGMNEGRKRIHKETKKKIEWKRDFSRQGGNRHQGGNLSYKHSASYPASNSPFT